MGEVYSLQTRLSINRQFLSDFRFIRIERAPLYDPQGLAYPTSS
jgi:hypothetical protein